MQYHDIILEDISDSRGRRIYPCLTPVEDAKYLVSLLSLLIQNCGDLI